MVFIIPSARREVELRDEKVAGYLAVRLDVRTFPEHQSAKKEPGQPDADHASHKTSREPEHASDEMPFAQPREMCLPLRAPADSHARPDSNALADSLALSLSRFSRSFALPILSLDVPFIALGRGSLLVTRSRVRFTQAWLALRRGPSEPIHDHIWEWNSIPERIPNTPAFQRACRACREQMVIVVVVGDVGDVGAVVVVVSDVKILTIKITHSACTFIHPLNEGRGP